MLDVVLSPPSTSWKEGAHEEDLDCILRRTRVTLLCGGFAMPIRKTRLREIYTSAPAR